MRRTDFTYGQLDKVLRSLGFTCRVIEGQPPVRLYEHKQTGAEVSMPPFAKDDLVLEYHLVAARFMADQFGVIEAKDFDALLQKAARRKVRKSRE